MRDSVKMTYPATLLTTLAATALTSGCAAASASGPRFPERLPPHTAVAYAQSYGGFVGGSASVIVTSDGKARLKCRFGRKTLHRHVSPHRWDKVLRGAHLGRIKSDDPNRPPVESPQVWFLHHGRVTYLQSFSHRNGLPPGVAKAQQAFERYLNNNC